MSSCNVDKVYGNKFMQETYAREMKTRSDRAGRYKCFTDTTQISPFTMYMHMNAVSDFYIEL